MRILVVEDSAAQNLVLCRMLQGMGHETVPATSGAAALALAAGRRFDVVLTDLSLPGMSGQTLLQTLHAQGCAARMIAVTAGAARVPLADAVLRKPVTKQMLLRALNGRTARAKTPRVTLLDRARIAQLQADVGGEQTQRLLRRFMAEADVVCAQKTPDKMALHHLAGSAGMFGARALHAALLIGAWQTIWPATRTALLTLLDQPA